MIAFVLGHLFIMHYQHVPSATGAAFVGRRWTVAGWREFDWILLMLALTHGMAGAHGVFRERIRRPPARAAVDGAFAAGILLFSGLGTAAVAVGPRAPQSGPGPLSGAVWIPTALIAGLVALATLTYLALAGTAAALAARLLRRTPIGRWNYPGQWAFGLSRVAGLGVLGFLLVHVLDVALVPLAPGLYERTVAGYALPYLIPMEVALVTAVIYHALNGLRLMVLEALDRRTVAAHVPSFVLVVVVTALLVVPSAVILLRGH
ncbi:MAG TPA: hypothetical protein VKV57_02025 [bacterium]|nr:hypothetical protein [bacterium]